MMHGLMLSSLSSHLPRGLILLTLFHILTNLPHCTIINFRNAVIDTFFYPEKMLKEIEKYNIIVLDVEIDGMNGINTAEMICVKNKHNVVALKLLFDPERTNSCCEGRNI